MRDQDVSVLSPGVSIVIPTRNRARSLKRLLDSIEVADRPGALEVEVLVVNNGSTDQTREMLSAEASRQRNYGLAIMEETRPGKARALNLGLTEARGDLLMVLDDDVWIDEKCLCEHVKAHNRSVFAAVQGRILADKDPQGRSVSPEGLWEYNIPVTGYGDDMKEARGLTGTNMSFTREVFERVGLFDVRLGPGAAGFSEDTEYSIRIRKAGFRIGYTPYAIAWHEVAPLRQGRTYNRATQYRKGLSRSIYRGDSVLFKVLPNLVMSSLRYGFYRLTGNAPRAYKNEGRMMKCCGYLAGKARNLSLKRSRNANWTDS